MVCGCYWVAYSCIIVLFRSSASAEASGALAAPFQGADAKERPSTVFTGNKLMYFNSKSTLCNKSRGLSEHAPTAGPHAAGRCVAVTRTCCQMAIIFLPCLFFQSSKPVTAELRPAAETLAWVQSPLSDSVQFDYEMSVRVRLLFFWAGRDNVGGGYIRHGIAKENPRQELLQVLFGSDPAKAPRAINRWGAGTEAAWHKNAASLTSADDDVVASSFFGFMKSSRGKSVSEMQEELRREKDQGEHRFSGILSRVEVGHATSLVVPLASNVDYTLHQYPEAEPLMIQKLNSSEEPQRALEIPSDCPRAGEFLGTVSQLLNTEIANPQARPSLCYVYDAQVNKLVVERTTAVPRFSVKVIASNGAAPQEKTYNDLLQTEFVSIHRSTGKKVFFTILTGMRGDLRGVPVQIRYQPNWWFQIVLNLLPKTQVSASTSCTRQVIEWQRRQCTTAPAALR